MRPQRATYEGVETPGASPASINPMHVYPCEASACNALPQERVESERVVRHELLSSASNYSRAAASMRGGGEENQGAKEKKGPRDNGWEDRDEAVYREALLGRGEEASRERAALLGEKEDEWNPEVCGPNVCQR